jgi:hypothetical protein
VNVIIVAPFLLIFALGFTALIVATLAVVPNEIASRRQIPAEARPRWLSGTSIALLTMSLAAISVVILWLGFSEQNVEDLTGSRLAGTWSSATSEAPGQLVFAENGRVEARDLTLFDDDEYWRSHTLVTLAEGLNADGSWDLSGYDLNIDFGDNHHEVRSSLLVTSSAFGGLTLRAIIGDPDGPAFTQDFKKTS